MSQKSSVYSVSGMTCSGCAGTVKRAMEKIPGVTLATVDHVTGQVELQGDRSILKTEVISALSSYPAYHVAGVLGFWGDLVIWNRAGLNTLNCLIGCSVGDFGMIIFLQAFYPGVGMAVQMLLATISGLITSVALETFLLKRKENMALAYAFRTAMSMSFLSMVAMELAMNTTDFMITGGAAAFDTAAYWFALIPSMLAGFIAPLPYNYYRLKKYNQACH